MSTEINISKGIPYTGATQSVDLGANNLTANNIFDGFTSVAASGTLITLTLASTPSYLITGSGGQTIKLPDATTLPKGALYNFNNNQSSGAILVNNNSNTLVKSVPSGGNMILELTDNATAAGSWDAHFQAPSNVSWSTNTLDYVGSITGATWNGVSVADNRIASSATWNAKQDALVSGTNIKTVNGATILGSGDLVISGGVTSVTGTSPVVSSGGATPAISMPLATNSVSGYLSASDRTLFANKQTALVSGSNLSTVNGNNLLTGTPVVVQDTLVSGTNIKTVNGQSILGSGNIIAGGNKVTQAETSINQYVAAAGFTNTQVFASPSAIVTSLGQVIDIDCLVLNQIYGNLVTMRFYLNTSPTNVGGIQIFNHQWTPTQTNQMLRYFRRFVVTKNNGTLNWYLTSMDPYTTPYDFTPTGANTANNLYPLGFNSVTTGGYLIITLNQTSAMTCVTIEY